MRMLRLFLGSLLALAVLACGGSSPLVAPPAAAAPIEGTVVYAVGDLAQCHGAAASETATARVARLIDSSTAPILMAGDLAYDNGSEDDFARCFDPVWGKFKPRIFPAPGNHEYRSAQAAPYFNYFGARAGSPGEGYYAVQIGAWRVIALNSNIAVDAGSPQERWLKQQLAEQVSGCTLAFWHHPRYSSGEHGDTPAMDALWRDLRQAGADIVISGHDHDYERFAPQGPAGELAPHGLRAFVVGTGGASLRAFAEVKSNSEARVESRFGVLKLVLGQASYSWEFVTADGPADRGQGDCRAAP